MPKPTFEVSNEKLLLNREIDKKWTYIGEKQSHYKTIIYKNIYRTDNMAY